jgi:PTS system mannose-specific IIB component/fructoselysine and glucoselysine-specific PTS system IIB component
MSIVLFRVDERLIHGQVVVGWGTKLRPDLIVVVDDALAGSEWEQELYTLGLPPELETRFETVESARSRLAALRSGSKRVFILTRDVGSMRRLAENGGMVGEEINIGGLHHRTGRRALLPYVFLSDAEMQDLRELAQDGVLVSARDLPGSRRVPFEDLVRNSGRA